MSRIPLLSALGTSVCHKILHDFKTSTTFKEKFSDPF